MDIMKKRYVRTEILAWIEEHFALLSQMFEEIREIGDGYNIMKRTTFQQFAFAAARLSGISDQATCACGSKGKPRHLPMVDPLCAEAEFKSIEIDAPIRNAAGK